jgi:probable rRNA maturation factor
VNIHQDDTSVALDADRAGRLEEAIFESEGKRLRVAVHVIGDEDMARAHVEFLGVEGTTDVITFDLGGGGPGSECAEDLDGEILVNAQLAAREAQERGHSAEAELMFYVAHGLLHLLGYDDGSDEEREAMLSLQARYLSLAGVSLES